MSQLFYEFLLLDSAFMNMNGVYVHVRLDDSNRTYFILFTFSILIFLQCSACECFVNVKMKFLQ